MIGSRQTQIYFVSVNDQRMLESARTKGKN